MRAWLTALLCDKLRKLRVNLDWVLALSVIDELMFEIPNNVVELS